MSVPTLKKANELIDPQAVVLMEFLQSMGLPSEHIIASQDERKKIGENLADLVEKLPAETKQDARYLSKFVLGAGFGLFDYSLNAVWNEVVLNLRKKVVVYGLDIFFDTAVGGSKKREFYQTEDDLAAIKDTVLLATCRKLELISDTTYKKLQHILDMRNDVGISHPTTYAINAFELLGWLQTCVSEVLNYNPTDAALKVQSFVGNLKSNKTLLDTAAINGISANFAELPTHLCASLLRTIFGIYVADETDLAVRKNISLIAPKLWASCLDEAKYKLGIVLQGYNINLYKDKYDLGAQFFEVVGGNAFRAESDRVIIIDELITELEDKHGSWDNFHHEPPVAAQLRSYIPDQSAILDNIAQRLFKTVLICRIGNGVNYNDGVSPNGKPHYDAMLAIAGDKFAPHVMAALTDFVIGHRLQKSNCRNHAIEALKIVKQNVINARLLECLDYLLANIESNPKCVVGSEFKKLSEGYIAW